VFWVDEKSGCGVVFAEDAIEGVCGWLMMVMVVVVAVMVVAVTVVMVMVMVVVAGW
jgi:hypothetical protein